MISNTPPHVALFFRFIGGGGAERMMLNLARSFTKDGIKVDLVLGNAGGPFRSHVPPEIRVIDLQASRFVLSGLPKLVHYLQQERPAAILSTLHYTNEMALWAKRIAGVNTRVIVREANHLSEEAQRSGRLKKFLVPIFVKNFYPWADGIVAISKGVAEDLAAIPSLSRDRIRIIYNPALTPDIQAKAQEPVDHPWFASGEPPVILAVGKLERQKDFLTLIRAFAQVRQVRHARLMILGWGPDQPQLEALVKELGLENDVAMPGYKINPFAYMAKAAVFVMSSAWEGFGNVLVEAMATGTPVISTDCKSGPAEILDDGKYGFLVPVGDSQALATSILKVLSGQAKQVDLEWIKQFSVETITQQYLEVLGIA
jgi:glycosyltransferase involved in cell wall biosynthesis